MFSRAVSVGIRLKDWKTNPIWSRRICVRPASSRFPISRSPTKVRPEVGVSSPAMQCMRVDLPEPDGPMTAVKRPLSNSTLMPSRACTTASPLP